MKEILQLLLEILTKALEGAFTFHQSKIMNQKSCGNDNHDDNDKSYHNDKSCGQPSSMTRLVPNKFKNLGQTTESFSLTSSKDFLTSVLELAINLRSLTITSPSSLIGQVKGRALFGPYKDIPVKLLKLNEKLKEILRTHDRQFGDPENKGFLPVPGSRSYHFTDNEDKVAEWTTFSFTDYQAKLVGPYDPYFSINLSDGMLTFRYLDPGSAIGPYVVRENGVLEVRLFELINGHDMDKNKNGICL